MHAELVAQVPAMCPIERSGEVTDGLGWSTRQHDIVLSQRPKASAISFPSAGRSSGGAASAGVSGLPGGGELRRRRA
jgi:hypothetical protein